jgi:hypothetical protein
MGEAQHLSDLVCVDEVIDVHPATHDRDSMRWLPQFLINALSPRRGIAPQCVYSYRQ